MELILEIRDKDVVQGAPDYDASGYKLREAARGVVLDQDNGVHLLDVTKHNYHKLPGGGIDKGEDAGKAFARECMEEIGCRVEVVADLGQVVEFRNEFEQRQISYCYLARQVGERSESALEESELAAGFQDKKAANIDEAIQILEQDQPDNYEGSYIHLRDLAILKAAKASIQNS